MNFLTILEPGTWVFLAAGAYTLGYLFINQMTLRVLVATGALCYIAYYMTAADTPLWGAIYSTLVTLAANFIGMATLLMRNMRWTIPKVHRDIYPSLQPLLPGDFRALMRSANRYVVTEETEVTTIGVTPKNIYFVLGGEFRASKFGMTFLMQDKTFVGEVSYLMSQPSAATTVFPAGTEVLEWDRAEIVRVSKRDPRFKLAFESVMSRDLARKVAMAVAPTVSNPQTAGNP